MALRAAWPEQIAGIAPQDFVFIEESGVNRAMSRLYARSLCGTRAFGSAPRNWGDNVSNLGGALPAAAPWRRGASTARRMGACF
jgi:hypothetical protein